VAARFFFQRRDDLWGSLGHARIPGPRSLCVAFSLRSLPQDIRADGLPLAEEERLVYHGAQSRPRSFQVTAQKLAQPQVVARVGVFLEGERRLQRAHGLGVARLMAAQRAKRPVDRGILRCKLPRLGQQSVGVFPLVQLDQGQGDDRQLVGMATPGGCLVFQVAHHLAVFAALQQGQRRPAPGVQLLDNATPPPAQGHHPGHEQQERHPGQRAAPGQVPAECTDAQCHEQQVGEGSDRPDARRLNGTEAPRLAQHAARHISEIGQHQQDDQRDRVQSASDDQRQRDPKRDQSGGFQRADGLPQGFVLSHQSVQGRGSRTSAALMTHCSLSCPPPSAYR